LCALKHFNAHKYEQYCFPTIYREKLCGRSARFNEFRGLRRSNIVHAKQRTLSRLISLQTRERTREKLYSRFWGL